MTKKDRTVLIDGLKKISTDIANLASVLEGADAQAQKTDESAEKPLPSRQRKSLRLRSRNRQSPVPMKTPGQSSRRSPGPDSGQR